MSWEKKNFHKEKCVKRPSKSATLSTVSAYSVIISSKQFHIEHTHILLGCRVSKQTFKSLQKYQILPICISFFFLFAFGDGRDETKIGMKAQRAIWLQRYTSESLSNLPPFHLCQCLLNLNVRTQGETLRLHREGKAVTSKLHRFRGEKRRGEEQMRSNHHRLVIPSPCFSIIIIREYAETSVNELVSGCFRCDCDNQEWKT